jgi:dipeptidyl aminopeptidase/acylaminoacyl peptidase
MMGRKLLVCLLALVLVLLGSCVGANSGRATGWIPPVSDWPAYDPNPLLLVGRTLYVNGSVTGNGTQLVGLDVSSILKQSADRQTSTIPSNRGLPMTTGVESRGSAAPQRLPVWKIVYSRNDEGLSVWRSSRRRAFRLTATPKARSDSDWPAAWSPDGKYIAFSRVSGQPGIYVARVGHGPPRRLVETFPSAYDVHLAWSPDSRKLAFSINCDVDFLREGIPCKSGKNGTTALYTIERDGSHLQRLVAVPRNFAPRPEIWGDAWSPDGRRIAYILLTSTNDCCGDFLYTIDAAGGKPQLVAKGRAGPAYELGPPSWAPNGRWIAYGDCKVPPITSNVYCDLVVRNRSGGNPRVLLRSFGRRDTGLWPSAWTPDSRTLLHSQGDDRGRPSLFAINVQTGRRRVVFRHFAEIIATSRDGRTFAFITGAGAPAVATLSGQIVDRGPQIPYFSGVTGGTASLWIH